MNLSVGIITHKDTSLIDLINTVLNQDKVDSQIKEVIIVSSGILDEIAADLNDLLEKNDRLMLIREPERSGKARSVNLFLEHAKSEVCILISGDISLVKNSISEIIKPLKDPQIGLVGSRPVPLNQGRDFISFAVKLIWEIHHNLAIIRPKVGELIAFKKIISEISPETAVDEAWIEAMITEKGLSIVYAPESIIHNIGPESFREYVCQRERIHIGHIHLKKKLGYYVSSMDYFKIFKALYKSLVFTPRGIFFSFLVIFLEVIIRLKANIDLSIYHRNPYCWDIIESAKFKKGDG